MLIPYSAVAALETVAIIIDGSDGSQKLYTLHKRLLTYHSGYFRRHLTDGVKTVHVDDLPELSIEGFDMFVDWMYERSLPSDTCTAVEEELMLDAYTIAVELSAGTLKNAAMDRLFNLLSDSCLSALNTEAIFDALSKDDPLLQFVVDSFCCNKGVQDNIIHGDEFADRLPQAFLVRVLQKMHHLSKLPEADRQLKREDYDIVECI